MITGTHDVAVACSFGQIGLRACFPVLLHAFPDLVSESLGTDSMRVCEHTFTTPGFSS